VIGAGIGGLTAAIALRQRGFAVEMIEKDPDWTVYGVGIIQQGNVLRALDAGSFDCAIIAIGGSLGDSVLATMNVKELGIPKVVCKAHDEVHRQVLLKLGADQVVIPEHEQAARLAKSLSSYNVLDYIELSGEYGIIEVPAPKSWTGKSLKELNVRAKLGVNILAIKQGDTIDVSPSADYPIGETDILVVLGDTAALEKVQKL
jgi:trk system potassium uptake protein TrkA